MGNPAIVVVSQQLRVLSPHIVSTRFEEHLGRNQMDYQRLFLVPSRCPVQHARVVAEDDDSSVALKPGCVCVMPARRPFRFEFPAGFMVSAFHFRIEGPGGCDVANDFIPFKRLEWNKSACDRAWKIMQLRKPADWLRAEALLRQYLADLISVDWTAMQQQIDQARDWQDVLEHLSTAPLSPGQISELAERRGITRHHFTRRFSETFGCTPRTWHRRHLSQRVVSDLLQRRDTLSTLADEHGFSDAFALSRFVSSSTGMNPKAIRSHGLFGSR